MVKISFNVNSIIAAGVVGVLGYFGWKKIKKINEAAEEERRLLEEHKEEELYRVNFDEDEDAIFSFNDEVSKNDVVILDAEFKALKSAIKNAKTIASFDKAFDAYKEFMVDITSRGALGASTTAKKLEDAKLENERKMAKKEAVDQRNKEIAAIASTVKSVASSLKPTPSAPMSNEAALAKLCDSLAGENDCSKRIDILEAIDKLRN